MCFRRVPRAFFREGGVLSKTPPIIRMQGNALARQTKQTERRAPVAQSSVLISAQNASATDFFSRWACLSRAIFCPVVCYFVRIAAGVGATSIPAVGSLRCIMEYGCVYSFVGRRSTTSETTEAAAAHLGVTTYMFFLIFVLVSFLRVLYNIHHVDQRSKLHK